MRFLKNPFSTTLFVSRNNSSMFQCLLIKEYFKRQKDLSSGHIVFLLSGEGGHVVALLMLNTKWLATLTAAARSIVHKFLKRLCMD